MVNFESAFDDFIDRREYDKAENALFSMVRICFTAGWLAAGGKPPQAQKVLQLYQKSLETISTSDCIDTDISLERE